MKVLVANLGSTSFKYSLYDMDGEKLLGKGRVERIGEPLSPCTVQIGDRKQEITVPVPDHAVAVRQCLAQLTDPASGCLKDASEVAAIGFKAVHAADCSGVQFVTPEVLRAMEELNDVMPAHNPPYVRAMRQLAEKLPEIPLVAAFETGFHQTIPDRNRYYGVPWEWAEKYSVVRWGFHGASHRYISMRTAELLGRDDLRIISCHLGGSSSICAVNAGKSVAASMGTSSQTGLFHNNRVGDFDPFMIPYLLKKLGLSLEDFLTLLATKSGLLGLSGVSGDLRDVTEASQNGNKQAERAVQVFIGDIRKYIGASLVELGGADVIVFTGGIGEYQPDIRKGAVRKLETLGIELNEAVNEKAFGSETPIHSPRSRTQIWVIPANEEIIVARQTVAKLSEKK
ncbi:MAG: acetate/propionate family kinase [Planctomycetaceae bacterium]|jgi:acetate kinase|nr:acetate/propionate family kinase [Planctomycetaceae bacterium]